MGCARELLLAVWGRREEGGGVVVFWVCWDWVGGGVEGLLYDGNVWLEGAAIGGGFWFSLALASLRSWHDFQIAFGYYRELKQ